MDFKIKQDVRPIYSELQGYLREAPEGKTSTTSDETIWGQFNQTIEELNQETKKNFDKFKVTNIQRGTYGNLFIQVSEYRTKLGGLIARLHGTYFYDEPAPFAGMPSTTINLSNQQDQHQTQTQTMVNHLDSVIENKLKSLEDGPEKSFLQELKSGLGSATNFVSLIVLVSGLVEKYNLNMSTVTTLLGGS
jgi:hypothetical protein